jgi:3-methyladenine DNA glycosylase AlkD
MRYSESDLEKVVNQLREDLLSRSSEKGKITGQYYFKEEIKTYGIRNPEVHKLSKQYYYEIKGIEKVEIFNLCDMLWQSGYIEEAIIACDWTFAIRKKYEKSDFKIFEKWIKNNINNWASCDTFCNHTIGEFVMQYPEFLKELIAFADSKNRWVKRAAAVSLIVPLRKGLYIDTAIEIANKLLLDTDNMVQKGYGWMLKVAFAKNPEIIYNYVNQYKAVMPRTALRYSIEKMPPEMKAELMQK